MLTTRLLNGLSLLFYGNTKKIKEVMPEDVPPLWRSILWGLQIFLDASAATVIGIWVINNILTQRGVVERLDPRMGLFAAGWATLLWMMLTQWKMPNFLGTSFTYILPIVSITTAIKGVVPDENPLAFATGAVILSSLTTFVIAFLVWMMSRVKIAGNERGELLYRFVPKPLAAAIVMIIGASLFGVATGMVQKDLALGLATLTLAAVFRFLPGYLGTIPLVLAVVVMYAVSIMQGRVDLGQFAGVPIAAMPQFIAPRFSLLGFVQMIPVSLATSFETLGHILVLEKLLARPLMNRLWSALFADGLCDVLGGSLGTSGDTTYAEVLGLFALLRVFANVAVVFSAIWAILFSLSGHLGVILNTIPEPVIGGIAVITFGMIFVPGLKIVVDEVINYANAKVGLVTAAMMVAGVGNLRLVIDGTEWLSGISFAIAVGIAGWYVLTAVEKIAERFWGFQPEPITFSRISTNNPMEDK